MAPPDQAEKEPSQQSDISTDGQDEKHEAKGGIGPYIRIFQYADKVSWTLNIISFIAAIAAGAVLPLMDLIFGKFITSFTGFAIGSLNPASFRSEVNKYTLYFIYLFIAKFVTVYIYSVAVSVSAVRTTKQLRIHFLKQTLRQDIAFFDSAVGGSVTTQVTTNCNNVTNGISEKLTLFIQGVSTFVAAFIVAFAVQWKLTLITICVVPAILIITGTCVVIDTKQESAMLAIYSRAGLLAEEVFSTIRTVHSYWLQPLLTRRYDTFLAQAEKIGWKKSPNYAVLFSGEYFCIFCAYSLAFWQGVTMYRTGEIKESGDVFTVVMAVILAATAMTTIAPQILVITKASSAAEELFQTIDRKSEIDPLSEDGVVPTTCTGDIEVRDVDFAYPARPDTQVLRGLTLSIPARKTTALVGASGSGKSTIIALLERWYHQKSGTITLDGTDIREINLRWLRTNIRLVQQEPVLFSGSVFENVQAGLIGTGKVNLSEAEQRQLVEQACKAAYADEFIQTLPEGYDTQVGERAMVLSGGQKQRIAIARSIVSDPDILLLDEATSALDPKAESIVQKALDNVSKSRTTIVIAHKLSTIKNADSIAVMNNGAVIEQGTHEELIHANGAYARLIKAQDLGQSSSPEDSQMNVDMAEMTLKRTETQRLMQVSTHHSFEERTKDKSARNLVSCVFIILREQTLLWPWFIVLGITSLLGGLSFPVQAVLFGRTIRVFELPREDQQSEGNFWALMFFVVALGQIVIYAGVGWSTNIVCQHVSRTYRREIFELILKQDMDFFDSHENTSGSLASNLSLYPTQLTDLISFNLALVFISIVSVVSSSIFAIIVGWKLGLAIVFGALPPLVFSGYLRIRLEAKLENDTGKLFASSAGHAAEAVSSIRTVSSLALESNILDKYQHRLDGVALRSTKAFVWTMFWFALTQSISLLAMALGFWYGGRLLSFREYSTNQFFMVFIAVIFSGEAAAQFFSYTTSMTKAQSAANFIFWLRSLVPAHSEDPSKPPHEDDKSDNGPAHLDCQDVSFAYTSRPNTLVLDNIDIEVRPGQSIALVGASGCGKSTTISLLERFYDPTAGRIVFDNLSLTELCPRKYRRNVALVQQEPVLYQGSVRDNIAMGIEGEATDAQIEQAARQSNIYDFVVSLPEGFATLCGSRGTQLSGGQRQRIAIARALIREPRLLLLDESTSALDTESERIVQAALDKAKSGRTTIAVAHRLSTIRDFDCIFVFAKGRIAECGTHAELYQKRGMYYEMCLGQSLDRKIPE